MTSEGNEHIQLVVCTQLVQCTQSRLLKVVKMERTLAVILPVVDSRPSATRCHFLEFPAYLPTGLDQVDPEPVQDHTKSPQVDSKAMGVPFANL